MKLSIFGCSNRNHSSRCCPALWWLSRFFDQSLDTEPDIDNEEENVGVKVLKDRLAVLERTAPDNVKEYVFERCKRFVDEFVSLVAEARDDLDFLVDLVIAASRPWEAWTSSEGP